MPRVCTACGVEDREALNRALLGGGPLRRIAEVHGLSESALRRHPADHVPKTLALAETAVEAASAERLLADAMALEPRAVALVERAEVQGDLRAAVVALREARECVALRARVATELRREDGISFRETKTLITNALERMMAFVPEEERERALAELENLGGELHSKGALGDFKIELQVGPPAATTLMELVKRASEDGSDREDTRSPDQLAEILEGLESLGAFNAPRNVNGSDSESADR